MPATLAEPHPLEVEPLVVGIVNYQCIAALVLIGQSKLTRLHAADLFLPGVRVKRNRKPSLYNVERSGDRVLRRSLSPNLSLCFSHVCTRDRSVVGSLPRAASQRQQENPEGDTISGGNGGA